MENRLKFRAKRVDSGEWVSGHFALLGSGIPQSGGILEYGDMKPFILSTKTEQSKLYSIANAIEVVVTEQYEIELETLGQCTGLVDLKKSLIYEGHIVKHTIAMRNHSEADGVIVNIFEVKWDFELLRDLKYFCSNDKIEIIGTKFENSHLLKGGE